MNTRVLVTGAGGAAAMAFMRGVKDEGVVLFAGDMNPAAAGLCMVPPQHRVNLPPGSDPDFADTLLQTCRRLSVEVLVPMAGPELLPIAARRRDFSRSGIRILLASDRTLEFSMDRLAVLQACDGVVPVPRYAVFDNLVEPAAWSYPVIVRPRVGDGNRVVHSAAELRALPRSIQYIVEEYLTGDEYCVNVFADLHGRVLSAIPRLRLKVNSGVLATSQMVRDPELIDLATRVARRIDLTAAANIRFRRDADQRPRLVDVVPRFRGPMGAGGTGAVNVPLLSLKAILSAPNRGEGDSMGTGNDSSRREAMT